MKSHLAWATPLRPFTFIREKTMNTTKPILLVSILALGKVQPTNLLREAGGKR